MDGTIVDRVIREVCSIVQLQLEILYEMPSGMMVPLSSYFWSFYASFLQPRFVPGFHCLVGADHDTGYRVPGINNE